MKRGVLLRVVLAVIAIPFSLLFVTTGLATMGSDPVPGAVITLVALSMLAITVWGFVREQTVRLWIGDDGVELHQLGLVGMKRTLLYFNDIDAVFLAVKRIDAGGGLVGALATAAVEAATRPATGGINEQTSSVQVKVRAGARTITLTNGHKGVVGVYRAIVDATQKRLLDAARALVGRNERASFGPYAVERGGVVVGKDVIAFADIKDFAIEDGTLRLKKEGAWLSKANPPIARIPNVDVLVALVGELRAQTLRAR